jgi:hypothetical protein
MAAVHMNEAGVGTPLLPLFCVENRAINLRKSSGRAILWDGPHFIVDSFMAVNRHFVWRAASAPPDDGQEKGKKKASDGRHDVKNPDVFNGPHRHSRCRFA